MYRRMQDLMEDSGAYVFLTHEVDAAVYSDKDPAGAAARRDPGPARVPPGLRGALRRANQVAAMGWKDLERAKGFEPSTPTLARLCSTPELRPRVESRPIRTGAT